MNENSEGRPQQSVFSSPPDDPEACWSLRTIDLRSKKCFHINEISTLRNKMYFIIIPNRDSLKDHSK